MVGVAWLLLGYLLHTTGELCVSPVGLSMVTRLSPARIVSTVMGGWFLATAFSQYLAGLIAQLTGVRAEEGAAQVVPEPIATVHLYGDVFGQIAVSAVVAALVCFALVAAARAVDAPRSGRGGLIGARATATAAQAAQALPRRAEAAAGCRARARAAARCARCGASRRRCRSRSASP